MIKLNLSSFVSLCLFISVVGLLGAWLFFECRRKIKNSKEAKGNIWHCNICTYVYSENADNPQDVPGKTQDSPGKVFSVCPKCGSYNSRQKTENRRQIVESR